MKKHQLSALRALLERVNRDDAASAKIRAIFSRLEKEATAIYELATNSDPMKSAVANDLLLNAEKARFRELNAKSQIEFATVIAEVRAAEIAAQMQKANLVPDEHAAEIRSVFRDLDNTGKTKFMAEALKAKDGSIIAAITSVPTVLSGMPAEQVAHYRESFINSVAPDKTDVADELQVICDTALQTTESFAQPVGAAKPVAPVTG